MSPRFPTAILILFLFLLPAGSLAAKRADRLEGVTWRATANGAEARGLRVLSGADGATTFATRGKVRALTSAPGASPASLYLYFDIEDASALEVRGPVYVVVEYFDSGVGAALLLHYDSATGDTPGAKYLTAEEQAGGWRMGTGRWKTAIFRLEKPQFANRQNLGADFRLAGGPMAIRSIRLTHVRPLFWQQADRMEATDIKPLVKIGAGGQLIVGGFDPARLSDARSQSRALEASLPALKALGVTSHELYVRWNLCEPEKGRYDWSVYDRYVALYKKHKIRWVPFLIVGSAYSLPDWYYKKYGSRGYVCLEHQQESDVQSLWNPALRGHVSRFLKAFCEHYRDSGVIESILLGITGNYGEAIYPVTGNDWTADIHGPYHSHPGLWCGDEKAVASFRLWLIRKYGGSGPLRDAWGTAFPNINEVQPFVRKDAPCDRAWLDEMEWYAASMTDWARFWLQETRKHFPKGDIYLCTGGDAPPEHGADFGAQCKAAAEVGGGVRITNEGSDPHANVSLTRWVASAGKQYGAYYSFEPAGAVDASGVIARIYNATASGARGLHYYFGNLFDTEAARANFVRYGAQFRQRKPVSEIAVWYPQACIRLRGNDFLGRTQPLRDRFDFDFLSDGQIADNGLKRYRALILLHGSIAEADTWRRIANWVREGGLLLWADGLGKLRTVESTEAQLNALLAPGANTGKGRVKTFSGSSDGTEYRAFLSRTLAEAPELSPNVRAMIAADGEEEGALVTLCAPNELLWLNRTGISSGQRQRRPEAKGERPE